VSDQLPCVIGIDVGTSGVRVIAVAQDHAEIAMSRLRFNELGQEKKLTAKSPELWWLAVELAIRDILKKIPNYTVVAMAVDGTSGSVLPIDESGVPLSEPLMYNDAVEEHTIIESIAASMPLTSGAGGATSGLAKVVQFATLKPHAVIHQADWIVGQLCGEYCHSDTNNALKSGFDPVGMIGPDWIDDVADGRALLPDVATPGD